MAGAGTRAARRAQRRRTRRRSAAGTLPAGGARIATAMATCAAGRFRSPGRCARPAAGRACTAGPAHRATPGTRAGSGAGVVGGSGGGVVWPAMAAGDHGAVAGRRPELDAGADGLRRVVVVVRTAASPRKILRLTPAHTAPYHRAFTQSHCDHAWSPTLAAAMLDGSHA